MKQLFISPQKRGSGDGSTPENAICGLPNSVFAARGIDEAVELHLLPGEYALEETLVLDERDSGTSFVGHDAVVTGGKPLTDWHDAGEGIVWTKVPAEARFTQFFVNGERREWTRYPEEGILFPGGSPAQSDGWANDVSGLSGEELANRLLYFKPEDLPENLYRPEDIEFVVLQFWMEARLCLEKWNRATGEALMKSGSWRPLTWSYGYYLENVREGLTAPGRWYHDRRENRLYYHLGEGERIGSIRAAYPVLRTLIEVKPSAGQKAENLSFEGITFSVTDGHPGGSSYHSVQAELNAPVAVRMSSTAQSVVRRCAFSNLGAWALWLKRGCGCIAVERCAFTSCGAGAVRIGEAERPKDPSGQTEFIRFANNRIADCGAFYLGSAGVWIGQSGHNTVAHNEISGPLQWAVSVGWNWQVFPLNYSRANRIEKNYVHDLGTGILGTHGALYVLGVSPETVVEGNRVENVHGSKYWGAGEGIILDNSCSGITVQNNLVRNAHAGGWGCNFDCFGNVIRNNIFAYGTSYQLTRYGDAPSKDPPPPNGEIFSQNIVLWENGPLFKEKDWPSYSTFWDYNLYWNPNAPVTFMGRSLEEWNALGLDIHSAVADPGFADPQNGDFTLGPDSPALRIGFEPFSLEDAGILPESGRSSAEEQDGTDPRD
ncbi:MAG: right-handed parallel beta-helix repeat-containing protein [Clostridia bacterium]|nr:right-handed parallel beta-helix repeat-containing protein [Clostridia bacterium]